MENYKVRVLHYKVRMGNYKVRVLHYKSRVGNYKVRVRHYKVRVEDYKVRVRHYKVRMRNYKVRVLHYKVRVEDYKVRVLHYKLRMKSNNLSGILPYLTSNDGNAGSFRCCRVSSFSFLKAKKKQKTLARNHSLGRGGMFDFNRCCSPDGVTESMNVVKTPSLKQNSCQSGMASPW